jgi:hypothetical protein
MQLIRTGTGIVFMAQRLAEHHGLSKVVPLKLPGGNATFAELENTANHFKVVVLNVCEFLWFAYSHSEQDHTSPCIDNLHTLLTDSEEMTQQKTY